MTKKLIVGSIILIVLVCVVVYSALKYQQATSAFESPDPTLPMQNNTSAQDAGSTATVCNSFDWSAEKKIIEELTETALQKEILPWERSLEVATSSSDFPFASVFVDGVLMEDIAPCEYSVHYILNDVSSTTLDQSFVFDSSLENAIRESNWNNEPAQHLVSRSTGMSADILLNNAGGPGQIDTIYTQSVPGQRAIRFLRLSEVRGVTYPLGSPLMNGDDQCPCTRMISLNISMPITLESLAQRRD